MDTIQVTFSIFEGPGTHLKDVGIGATVLFDASATLGVTNFEWEFLSFPGDTQPLIASPFDSMTRIGPVNNYGVYQLKLWTERHSVNQKSKVVSFSVPGPVSPRPLPPDPGDAGGANLVQNGSFEIEGLQPGYALYWYIVDDPDILATGAGTTRGRIQPSDFTPDHGSYAMCLGDENNALADFRYGEEFSVYQYVDFTNAQILKLKLKLKK